MPPSPGTAESTPCCCLDSGSGGRRQAWLRWVRWPVVCCDAANATACATTAVVDRASLTICARPLPPADPHTVAVAAATSPAATCVDRRVLPRIASPRRLVNASTSAPVASVAVPVSAALRGAGGTHATPFVAAVLVSNVRALVA